MHLSSWTVGISLALAGLAAAEKPTPAASNRPTASTNSMPMLEDGKPAKMTVILDDASNEKAGRWDKKEGKCVPLDETSNAPVKTDCDHITMSWIFKTNETAKVYPGDVHWRYHRDQIDNSKIIRNVGFTPHQGAKNQKGTPQGWENPNFTCKDKS